MSVLHLDAETYSATYITKGLDRYFGDPTYELLMLAWAVNQHPVNLWVPAEGEPMPPELKDALESGRCEIHAFNAAFEYQVVRKLGIWVPIRNFRCTMVSAWSRSFAGSLEKVQAQLGMPQDTVKMKDGQKLIHRFGKPAPASHTADRYDRYSHPEDWAQFKAYCRQDVIAERELELVLGKYPNTPAVEHEYWCLDHSMNQRGLQLDLPLVESALRVDRQVKKRLGHVLRDRTGLDNPGSRDQFLSWLADYGVYLADTRKETIAALLGAEGDHLPEVVKEVCRLRGQLKKTSNAKWRAMKDAVGADGRLCNVFQFAGAQRTKRWAGRIVQPHNLPGSKYPAQPEYEAAVDSIRCEDARLLEAIWGDPQALLSQSIRGAIVAAPGNCLIVSDYSAIESRALGWLAKCEGINRVFAQGLDSYKDFATHYYRVPYGQITKAQRKFVKPVVLGAGYMLGWRGLIAYAEGYGVSMSEDEAKRAIRTFRGTYREVPLMWGNLMEACELAIRQPGNWFSTNRVSIGCYLDMMLIRLPGGRFLHYHQPLWRKQETPWGAMSYGLSYMGMDQNTHNWKRIKAHAGLVTENIDQALSRDILADGLLRADRAGLNPVGHVHDEIIAEVPIEGAEEKLQKLIEIMSSPPPWAEGLLLSAAGWTGRRYRKD